jgi:hypothetical protein
MDKNVGALAHTRFVLHSLSLPLQCVYLEPHVSLYAILIGFHTDFNEKGRITCKPRERFPLLTLVPSLSPSARSSSVLQKI